MREYKKKNPEKLRATHLKHKFGLSIEQYDSMMKAQNGVCMICKNPCASGRRLAVDHDHETNRVRGLLCMACNQALGFFRDNVSLLKAAIAYLKKR